MSNVLPFARRVDIASHFVDGCFPNGREYLYLGPDAGPPDDPNAYGTLRDLVGPDGVARFRGRRYRWGANGRVPPRCPSPVAAEPAEPPQ